MWPATAEATVGAMAESSLVARARQALAGSGADVALAAALAVFAELDVLLSQDWRGPTFVNAVVVPAMALALAFRRRRPLTTLAVVIGGYVGLSLAFGASQTWSNVFIIVIAVYSAVTYGSAPLLAAALTLVGVVVGALTDPLIDGFGDAVWGASLIVLTVGAGLTGRGLRARTKTLDDRAEALDRDEQRRAAEAAAEERRRIARELHDIISHSLGVVVLQAGAAERVLDRDPERARDVLESIRATGQEAIGEMGTLLGLLDASPRSSRQPQPSLADLDGLVSRMRDAGLSVELTIEGEQRVLPAALELSAFRVMQEALTNALKHAGPARAAVTVRYEPWEVVLQIIYDGAGVPEHELGAVGGGHGIVGMRERVGLYGGSVEAGPAPGGGFAVRARLPVAQAAVA
jgi:signal transduction histidine kinase